MFLVWFNPEDCSGGGNISGFSYRDFLNEFACDEQRPVHDGAFFGEIECGVFREILSGDANPGCGNGEFQPFRRSENSDCPVAAVKREAQRYNAPRLSREALRRSGQKMKES